MINISCSERGKANEIDPQLKENAPLFFDGLILKKWK
jgi:hypothetical protein